MSGFVRIAVLGVSAVIVMATSVWAQTLNSVQAEAVATCERVDAETCFYTAADFASGQGVPEDKAFAQRLFLKACDKGVPDGCNAAGRTASAGWGNVQKDVAKGIDYTERACRMGHVSACDFTYKKLAITPDTRDIPRALIAMEAGCAKQDFQACNRGAAILYDGRAGQYPGHIDFRRAAPLAGKACDGNALPKVSCMIAADIYLRPDSPAFNAAKALRYARRSCDDGNKTVCSNLGGIYQQIEDYESAAKTYARACELGKDDICDHAEHLRGWLTEWEEYRAQEAADKAMIDPYLNAGQYGTAVNVALREMRSSKYAALTTNAAIQANAMNQISTNDLYVLASWYRSGPIRAAADREMASRGTALEGRSGTGTNNAGQAHKRWLDARGGALSTTAPSSRGSIAPPRSGLSVSGVREQARRDFKAAHCNMTSSRALHACR